MQEEWGFLYCYNCHIIHVNKTRSNWHKRRRNHTHTNSTVVLDGIILDTLHEGKTSANSENMWGYVSETILFRQEFSASNTERRASNFS
jgi:hypothetical protein